MFKNKKLDECRGGFVSKISPKVTWLTERFNRFIIFAISANGRLLFCCSYMFVLIGLWSTCIDDLLATWAFEVRAIQFWLLPSVRLLCLLVVYPFYYPERVDENIDMFVSRCGKKAHFSMAKF